MTEAASELLFSIVPFEAIIRKDANRSKVTEAAVVLVVSIEREFNTWLRRGDLGVGN